MINIHLKQVKLFSPHGVLDEEHIIHNELLIDCNVGFEATNPIESLDDTIDYVMLYKIIQNNSNQKGLLLEKLAQKIIEEIHQQEPRIKNINITISKLNPPIANFSGQVGVSISKSF